MIFLLCALALPAQSAKFVKLEAFFKMHKGYEIYMTDEKGKPDGKDWSLSRVRWQGLSLWIRRDA